MAFDPGIAYGVAITTALALICMSAKNRQSGWRKERTDGVLDLFMTWAQARQEASMRPSVPQRQPLVLGPSELGDQLAALMVAVNTNAGASVSSQPAQPAQPAAMHATAAAASGARYAAVERR